MYYCCFYADIVKYDNVLKDLTADLKIVKRTLFFQPIPEYVINLIINNY